MCLSVRLRVIGAADPRGSPVASRWIALDSAVSQHVACLGLSLFVLIDSLGPRTTDSRDSAEQKQMTLLDFASLSMICAGYRMAESAKLASPAA